MERAQLVSTVSSEHAHHESQVQLAGRYCYAKRGHVGPGRECWESAQKARTHGAVLALAMGRVLLAALREKSDAAREESAPGAGP